MGGGCIVPPFLTSAQDGGERLHIPSTVTTGKDPQYLLIRWLGWPNTLFGRNGEKKTLASIENRTPTVQSIAVFMLRCPNSEVFAIPI
jgi:hypothetical protein